MFNIADLSTGKTSTSKQGTCVKLQKIIMLVDMVVSTNIKSISACTISIVIILRPELSNSRLLYRAVLSSKAQKVHKLYYYFWKNKNIHGVVLIQN